MNDVLISNQWVKATPILYNKGFIGKLLCRHSYYLSRWHWCHGINGNDPLEMEVEIICPKCGKKKYWHINRNTAKCRLIEKLFADRKW